MTLKRDIKDIYAPTYSELSAAISKQYNTNVYRGEVVFSLESTFSLYLQGRQPISQQWPNISNDIYSVWKQHRSKYTGSLLSGTSSVVFCISKTHNTVKHTTSTTASSSIPWSGDAAGMSSSLRQLCKRELD